MKSNAEMTEAIIREIEEMTGHPLRSWRDCLQTGARGGIATSTLNSLRRYGRHPSIRTLRQLADEYGYDVEIRFKRRAGQALGPSRVT